MPVSVFAWTLRMACCRQPKVNDAPGGIQNHSPFLWISATLTKTFAVPPMGLVTQKRSHSGSTPAGAVAS